MMVWRLVACRFASSDTLTPAAEAFPAVRSYAVKEIFLTLQGEGAQADDGDEPSVAHATLKRTPALARCLVSDAPERLKAGLRLVAADFADVGDPVQSHDLPFTLDPGRMIGRESTNQRADAFPQLKREVGGGGAHQLADVLDRDRMALTQAVGMLGLTHFCGTTSSRLSIWAWTATEIAEVSPITQPWL